MLKYLFTFLLLLSFALAVPASANEKISFVTLDSPPYSYMENGQIKGPGPIIIKAICTKLNVDYEIKLLPWRRALITVSRGLAQAIFFLSKNEQRELWLDFSPPIFQTEYGIFECATEPLKYKRIEDLKGKMFAAFSPSNALNELRIINEQLGGQIEIDITADSLSPFRKLNVCRVDGIYNNKDVGLAIIQRENLKNINYAATIKKLNYCIGFSKQHTPPNFVKEFNKHLIQMKKSGELAKILKKINITPSK
ncbi:MAG: hypothetical protein BA863_09605 [Desulfovibrio sp. S3730MH75]|nr:MAG: hypothetical protein BA863_09605 [Desulfovibrio sp. S3730MH75]